MKIRTSQPSNNKYYIRQVSGGLNGAVAGQPTIKGANVLCNCVGYANGRFNEIIGDPNLIGTVKAFGYQLVCNAEDFIESARRQGLTISPTPIEGGIMVWAKGRPGRGSDGAGHVAVVEEVYADGTILTSESGWNAWAFKTVRRSNANGRWGQTSAYSFRGCVVNPGVPNPKVVPVPPLVVDGIGGEATVMAMQRFFGTPVDGIISGQIKGLHRYYPSLTAVSYIGAPSTCIKALQKWVGVPDDGYLGADTTKAWQAKLGVKDDGIFGPDSMRAWQKYLNDHQEPEPPKPEPPKPTKKVEEDGIGGPATVKLAQSVFGTQVDGNISGQNKALKKYYPSLTAVTFDKVKSTLVKRLQKWVGVDDDGVWGAATSKGLQHKLNSEGYDAGDEDSIFGARSMRAFQAWLNDHDSPTPDTPQPTKNIFDKGVEWLKKIAADNSWHYVKYNSNDAKTKECPICHNHAVGKYHGWNCIGESFAFWRHGCGIPCKCANNVINNAIGDKVLKMSDAEALKTLRSKIGLTDIQVIRNGGNTIPQSWLKKGDICLQYKGNTYVHTFPYIGDGYTIDCGSYKDTAKQIAKRKAPSCKVAIRYIGK